MGVRLVLLGVPGAGKGTQGRRLRERFGVPQIATGEILRAAVKNETPLGLQAKERMEAGLLIPDQVMIGIVEERLAESDAAEGFVLDGFPRTIPQAKALDGILARRGTRLDAVLYLTAPVEVVVKRLTNRRECPVCHRAYNSAGAEPREPGRCDTDGAELVERADDSEPKVRRRIEVFFEETKPLESFYAASGRLRRVDGDRSPDEVFETIVAALEAGDATTGADGRKPGGTAEETAPGGSRA